MLCSTRGKKTAIQGNTFDSLPEPIQQLYTAYKHLSEEFSQEDIIALYDEFNQYTGDKDMNVNQFKLIMRSLNV
jgi:hypothetical protein